MSLCNHWCLLLSLIEITISMFILGVYAFVILQNPFEPDEGIQFTVSWMVKVLEESKNTVSMTHCLAMMSSFVIVLCSLSLSLLGGVGVMKKNCDDHCQQQLKL